MAGSPYIRILHMRRPFACPAVLPVSKAWLMRDYAIPASRPPGCYTLATEKGRGAAGFKAFGFIVHYNSRRTKFVK